MAKILFIGDVHVKHKNIAEIECLMKTLATLTREFDFCVIAGDLLDSHEKIDSQLMNRAYDLVKAVRSIARVFVLVGNHDYINNQQFLTRNHWMTGMAEWKNVTVCDRPTILERADQTFVFVPYVYPGRFVEALNLIGDDDDWKQATCVFAHQEIRGCKMGAIESTIGDEWLPEWPQLISGHIHEHQTVSTNVLYPGSVLSHAFGYESQGLWKFDFSTVPFGTEKIELDIPLRKTVFSTVTDVIDEDEMIQSNRFSFKGTESEIAAFKKSDTFAKLNAKNVKMIFRPEFVAINAGNDADSFSKIVAELISIEDDAAELMSDYKTVSSK